MFTRGSFALTFFAMNVPTDTFAQSTLRYQQSGFVENAQWALNVGFVTMMIIIVICAISCAWIDVIREKASESETQLRRQARLMREMTAHQDSHTDMMRSEIERSRTHGEHRDLPQIEEHEQRLRDLRRKY